MPQERVASPLMLELEPVVIDTYSRHIDTATPWYAHDYVPFDRGQNFKALGGHDWDPSQVTLPDHVTDALEIVLISKDNLAGTITGSPSTSSWRAGGASGSAGGRLTRICTRSRCANTSR
jgi:hypothetical protein